MKQLAGASAVCLVLLHAMSGVANAAMPVIDVAAIARLGQEVSAWDEQLQGMRLQLGGNEEIIGRPFLISGGFFGVGGQAVGF